MKNVKLILLIISLLLSNTLFAGQGEERPEITKDKGKQELLVKITKKDKMQYKTKAFSTRVFLLKNFEFYYKDLKQSMVEMTIIKRIFYSAHERCRTNFDNIIKIYKQIFFEKNNKYANLLPVLYEKTAASFNIWLAKSQENRDKIARILSEIIRDENILKEKEKKREKERIKHLKKLAHGKSPVFLGANLNYLGGFSGNGKGGSSLFSAGVEFINYFGENIEKFNLGISLFGNYSYYKETYLEEEKETLSMFSTGAVLLLKFGTSSRMFFTQGFGIGLETAFNGFVNFNGIVFSGITIIPKSLQCLFSLKVMLFLRESSQGHTFLNFGISLSVLFNIS